MTVERSERVRVGDGRWPMTSATGAAGHPGGRSDADPHHIGNDAAGSAADGSTGGGTGGPATPRIVVSYGFWLFLISDIILFASFFAAYAVLVPATAGGPRPQDLFELKNVGLETTLLLLSSFTCGMATIAADERHPLWTQLALLVTGLLGLAFLLLELREFTSLVQRGAGPQRSAFLSAFYSLVGCHGLHVGIGLLWIGTMMAQFVAKGFRDDIMRRMACFALFWHALDIVWVGVMTSVYLLGVRG